jgi:hypothetical protein
MMIAKAIFLIAGLRVIGYNEGVGAYYAPGVMERVCVHRVQHNWTPDLQCDWPCLVSGIEQQHLGEFWLVDLPGGSMHVCQVVDVGATEHLEGLRQRGEVVEVSWEMAQDAGWDGYEEGVRVWRLEP